MDRRRHGRGHEGVGRGFRHDPKLALQPLGQCRVVPFRRTSIAGKQEAANQMPAIHLAQRVELDKACRVSRRGKMFAGGILVLHEAFQPLHEPSPERLAAIERPIVELGTISQREAREEVAPVEQAGFLERASVAGALEELRIDLQLDRHRPSHAGVVGLEDVLPERRLDAVKQAPQSRAGGLAGTLGPQQRGNDVPCNGALRLREIDQQRKTLAQAQLDQAVVTVNLRQAERLKREFSHEITRCPNEAFGGRAGDAPVIAVRPDRACPQSNDNGETSMFTRLLVLSYAIVSYAVFLVSSLYAIGFVGNFLVPKSIDVGGPASLGEALVVNLLLLGAFAVQHSIMARSAFKRWWAGILPVACQRSTYVLLSSLILLLLFWQWRPIPMLIWRVDGIAAGFLIGVYALGWLVVFASTFMIDHFDLSGLRQAFFALRGVEAPGQSFRTPLLYKIVRHPLMLGFLLAFWATPEMTAGHLLFAIMTTAYILVGLQFEERDLIAAFGATYQQYRQRVPMLLPRVFTRRRAGAPQ